MGEGGEGRGRRGEREGGGKWVREDSNYGFDDTGLLARFLRL